jgi:NADH:ubiquinone oxidoreductase subunit 2 (subunit N)
MITINNTLDNLVILITYMFIYNLTLLIIFWTLYHFISFNFKTIYSFNDLKFNFFYVFALSISFFSLAGVPPFIGFFSKILILLLLLNTNFALLYYFFLYYYFSDYIFIYKISDFCIILIIVKFITPLLKM